MKTPLLFVVLAVMSLPVHADPALPGNRLDQLNKAMSADGVSIIKSYRILTEYQRVDIQLEPTLWDSFTISQQLRLCDALANTDFLQKMKLLDAHLYVDSTEIGSISPNMWGGGNSFSKDERYWNP